MEQDWAHRCHICSGGWAHPAHICAGTGLTPPTSAPGLGVQIPLFLKLLEDADLSVRRAALLTFNSLIHIRRPSAQTP